MEADMLTEGLTCVSFSNWCSVPKQFRQQMKARGNDNVLPMIQKSTVTDT
jgi:hypothetical protein